jgi:1-acyl-sn-glycerol-3-phosphate acyltransferase
LPHKGLNPGDAIQVKIFGPIYFIYKLWIGLVFWLTMLILYPAFRYLLSDEKLYPKAFKLKRFWSKWLQYMMFCPMQATFKAPMPTGAYIIVSNHSSYLDTVFMYGVFRDYFVFIGKGELLKWPLFRRFFMTMDIPVQRSSNKKSFDAMQKASEVLKQGRSVAMFPEGTIPEHAPHMKGFKNGAFHMAIHQNVPIVPVTWIQNYKIMFEPSRFFEYSLPHTVKVIVHEPIFPNGNSEQDLIDLRTKVFRTIDSGLPEEFRKYKINKPT